MNDDNDVMRVAPRGLTPEQTAAIKAVDRAADAYLEAVNLHCPEGRATALARTKLEESAMWATKGIMSS